MSLRHDRNAIGRIGAILLVGMLVLASLVVVISTTGGASDSAFRTADGKPNTCTVYITEAGTNKVLSAQIDLSKPELGEQMFLSFNQGVRPTVLAAADIPTGISGIKLDGKYSVGVAANIAVSGEGLSSPTLDVQVTFSAAIINPAAGMAYADKKTGNSQYIITGEQDIGTAKLYDSCIYAYTAPEKSGQRTDLLGANLDGMSITVNVLVTGQDGSKTVSYTCSATFTMAVLSWVTASVQATITGITYTGPTMK